jgi:hypothetical protein
VLLANTWTPANYYIKIKQFDTYTLYGVQTTGYFDIVDVPAIFSGPKSDIYYPDIRWMTSNLPKQKQNPILTVEGQSVSNNISTGLPKYSFYQVFYQGYEQFSQNDKVMDYLSNVQPSAGRVTNETLLPNEYRADFTVTRNCYLMLKSNYHPGWTVTVDDHPVEPVMLTPGFVAVPVTPGTHQATFVYSPPPYRFPLFILSFLIMISLAVYHFSPYRITLPSLKLIKK